MIICLSNIKKLKRYHKYIVLYNFPMESRRSQINRFKANKGIKIRRKAKYEESKFWKRTKSIAIHVQSRRENAFDHEDVDGFEPLFKIAINARTKLIEFAQLKEDEAEFDQWKQTRNPKDPLYQYYDDAASEQAHILAMHAVWPLGPGW